MSKKTAILVDGGFFLKRYKSINKIRNPDPSIVVASSNDHVTDLNRSREFARNWGSKLVILNNAGHIEPKSGFGEWKKGLQLIKELEEAI